MSRLSQYVAAAFVALTATATIAAEPNMTTGPWSIVAMGGKRLRTPATINFTRVKWLGINTVCGPLWGWYRRSGTKLSMHITATTRFQAARGSPCHGIDYQVLLGRVRSFEGEGDQVVLMGEAGKPIARLVKKKQ